MTSTDGSASADDSTPIDDSVGSDRSPDQLAQHSAVNAETTTQTAESGRRRRIIFLSLAALGIVILGCVGWVAWRGYQAYHNLSAAEQTAADLKAEVTAHGMSDPQTLQTLADRFAQQSAAARSAVDDPVYGAAEILPWLGDNLRAVKAMAIAADDLGSAGAPVAELAASVQPSRLVTNGRIDLSGLEPLLAKAADLDVAVRHAQSTVAAVGPHGLVPQVARALTTVNADLTEIAPLADRAGVADRILQSLVGVGVRRRVLVVFQNPSELRATGGIFGTYAEVDIDSGVVSIAGTGSTDRTITAFSQPVAGVSSELLSLYSTRLAEFPQDVNLTPDFPTAASTLASMWQQRTGSRVDAVVAADPSLVALLLQGRPSIDLGSGLSISSSNVSEVLLSAVYQVFGQYSQTPQRDAFVAKAMDTVMQSAIASPPSDLTAFARGLQSLIDQRRLLYWSTDTVTEASVLTTRLAGRIAPDQLNHPTVGLFLNDGTGGKLDYYLDASATLSRGTCAGTSAAPSVEVTSTFTYARPPSDVSPYVVGTGPDAGSATLQFNLTIMAPTGGTVASVLVNGSPAPVARGMDSGRSVALVTVRMAPGQRATVTATVSAGSAWSGVTASPQIVTTPMVRAFPVTVDPINACGSR